MRNTFLRMAGLTALAFAWATCAANNVWPPAGKSVHIVVPSPAGGGIDAPVAKLLAKKLATRLHTPFNVVNQAAQHTPPTALPTNGTQLIITRLGQAPRSGTYQVTPIDPRDTYLPVGPVAQLPNIIVVTNTLPVDSLDEFTHYLRLNPGVINFASSGNGSASHIAGMLYMTLTDTNMVPVAFSSASQATSNLVSGDIQSMFHLAPDVAEQVRQHEVKALAVMGDQRLGLLPQVPTTAELGHPQLQASLSLGLMAPKGTPPDIIAQANAALNDVLADPEVVAGINALGAIAHGGTPQELDRLLDAELEKWRALVANGDGPPPFP